MSGERAWRQALTTSHYCCQDGTKHSCQTNCIQCRLLIASHNRLCIYRTKCNYNERMTLFFVNFWMDITHWHIKMWRTTEWVSKEIFFNVYVLACIGIGNKNNVNLKVKWIIFFMALCQFWHVGQWLNVWHLRGEAPVYFVFLYYSPERKNVLNKK